MIEISHLYKSYETGPVLEDFSAVLEDGKMTALMAPSGGGKTTLLRILLGLETPDSGHISGLSGRRIRAVFQEDRLCPQLNAVSNLRLVNPKLSPEAARSALSAVGLGDSAHQKISQLSGGMCRRVAILRALLSPWDVLLLDEPFRGLDAHTKALVMADTKARCTGKTVLLVTHDPTELSPMGVTKCLHF